MSASRNTLNRETFSRVVNMIRAILADEAVGRRVLLYSAGIVLFLLSINALNVLNSYVGRLFMTAIEERDRAGFWWYALLYVGVFALLTLIAVSLRYTEESLGLLWRNWMTWHLFRRYADHRVYYRLENDGDEVENPDQRLTEDVRFFTTTTLSYALMLANGGLTVLAFSGVLWSISPLLFGVAVAYASLGTWLTIRLGHPLVQLNYDQLDQEADFRASLIHLRDNADAVALARREGLWIIRAGRQLDALTRNFQRIIRVNRNLGFFTTGYNWMIQIIPALFVAPLFIEGRVEFGVITQSAVAFTQLLGAFSLIITQFQSLSSYTAVIRRIGLLADTALRDETGEVAMSQAQTEQWRDRDHVSYANVRLLSRQGDRALIENLTADIPAGQVVLVHGPEETARLALFQATAGLWPIAEGTLVRPPLEHILFVTERPYLAPGTLREMFLKPHPETGTDRRRLPELRPRELCPPVDAIHACLRVVGLGKLPEKFGGFEQVQDWDSVLSLAEQQLLVMARVLANRPRFVFLDRPGSSLPPDKLLAILKLLRRRGITPVVFSDRQEPAGFFDATLELRPDGKPRWMGPDKPGAPEGRRRRTARKPA